jgi:glutaredoxin 3
MLTGSSLHRGNAIVWSQENCSYCDSAKNMLKAYGYVVEERKIGEGEDWTKQDLIAVVPHARGVPQIFVNDRYVGGFQELRSLMTDRA